MEEQNSVEEQNSESNDNDQEGPICYIGPFDLRIVSYNKAKLHGNNRYKG